MMCRQLFGICLIVVQASTALGQIQEEQIDQLTRDVSTLKSVSIRFADDIEGVKKEVEDIKLEQTTQRGEIGELKLKVSATDLRLREIADGLKISKQERESQFAQIARMLDTKTSAVSVQSKPVSLGRVSYEPEKLPRLISICQVKQRYGVRTPSGTIQPISYIRKPCKGTILHGEAVTATGRLVKFGYQNCRKRWVFWSGYGSSLASM